MSKVRAGEVDIENVCLSCGDQGEARLELQPHPLFHGGVCNNCLVNLYHDIDSNDVLHTSSQNCSFCFRNNIPTK